MRYKIGIRYEIGIQYEIGIRYDLLILYARGVKKFPVLRVRNRKRAKDIENEYPKKLITIETRKKRIMFCIIKVIISCR